MKFIVYTLAIFILSLCGTFWNITSDLLNVDDSVSGWTIPPPPEDQDVGELIDSIPESPQFNDEDIIARTENFTFYSQDGYFPVDLDQFQLKSELVFRHISRQLNLPYDGQIKVTFLPPMPANGTCVVRGLANFDRQGNPQTTIFADENTSQEYLLGVLAHEVGHNIFMHNFDVEHTELNEGIATWASRRYWSIWQESPSLEENVVTYIEDDTYVPLSIGLDNRAYSGATCLVHRDIVYTEWASFVGYLIDQYGMDKFIELALTETVIIDEDYVTESLQPDYYVVYGLSLDELEKMWLESISYETNR